MSQRPLVRANDLAGFDTLIDARSPAEYALDHLPGAINCPVLDDEERRIVGTLYKQTGAFEARRVGGAMVAANLARHLREQFADRPAGWKPLVYCWRGGMSSGSMVTWMRMVGWKAEQLTGGYKSFRRHVIDQIATASPALRLRVVCGATGSAKTRVLHALERQGAQVLDLEQLACHKGSLLGNLPGRPQPSQKRFETLIATRLEGFDLERTVYVEGESPRIGQLNLPLELVARMRAAPCVEVVATQAARQAFLLEDYAYLGDDPGALAEKLGLLKDLQGRENVQRWQDWARDRALAPLFAELIALHYDPHYERSQARHFARWAQRDRIETDDLSAAGVEAVARRILSGDGAVQAGAPADS